MYGYVHACLENVESNVLDLGALTLQGGEQGQSHIKKTSFLCTSPPLVC